MILIRRAQNYWRRITWREQAFLIFILFLMFYGAMQWQTAFRDPDSFFHARMIEEIVAGGLVRDFPWLPRTVLANNFADQHLLYHLLLAPFGAISNGLLAVKIGAVIFAAGALTAFYLLLRFFRAPYPALFMAFVGLSAYGAQRLNLGKAGALALIIELAWIGAAFSGRAYLAGALAFIAVWTHGSWPMIGVLLGALFLARAAAEFFSVAQIKRNDRQEKVEAGRPACLSEVIRKTLATVWRASAPLSYATFIGLLLGNLINPYFPENFIFNWHQIIQIAVWGGDQLIYVGSEWYPLSARNMFTVSAPLIFLLWAGGAVAYRALKTNTLVFERASAERLFFSFLIAALFFVMSFRSIRHVEYFFPYAALFTASFWSFLLREERVCRLAYEWFARVFRGAFGSLLTLIFTFFLGLYVGVNVKTLINIHQHSSTSFEYLRGAAEFVARQSWSGELLYHSEWDNFPELWYWNRQNVFVSGLDARFLSARSPELARAYQEGIPKNREFTELLAELKARLVLVEKKRLKDEMIPALKHDRRFVIRYEDKEAVIFEWLDAPI